MSFPSYVKDICKIGQGKDTCRYLMMGGTWECAKLDPSMKATLDGRGESMGAQGDNCPGCEKIPEDG
jgi:hypothetical protein